jgi:hypothetical protein
VLTGAVGGHYGPFPRSSTYSNYGTGQAPFNHRDSMSSSDVAIDLTDSRFVPSASYTRYSATSGSEASFGAPNDSSLESVKSRRTETNTALLWDKENAEPDDYLHDPDPELERMLDRQWANWSARGWLNVGILVLLIVGLVGLFAG